MATPIIPLDSKLSINPAFKSDSVEKPVTLKFNPAFKVSEDRSLNVSYDLTNYQQNTDRYKRFIDEIYPGVNLERQAAQGQSPWGKVGNMFVQGVVGEILGQGVIGGAGSILSIPETITDSFHRDTADFGNFMTRFADTITNTLSESAPIFRYNEGKTFDWKDLGWWTSQGVSLFSTIGLLIPALGEAKAASYFSKALHKVAAISRLNKLNKTSKTFVAASDIFDTERYWQKITHSAIAMRNAENVRESSQAYTTIYNETLDTIQDDTKFQELLNSPIGQEFLSRGNGTDKNEFAKYIASKAAWKNYTMNAANVFFDAMQLAPLFKGFKVKTAISPAYTSKAVKTAQKSVVEGVSSLGTKATTPGFNAYPFIKGGTVLVGEQLSEGAEELVNAISQSEANWYGKYLIGSEKDEGKQNRYNAYLNDPSSWEQAFWGFAGGVAFSGVTRGLDKIQNLKNDTVNPYSDAARIEEIQNRYIKIGNTGKSINAIINGFNPNSEDGIFKGTDAEIEQQKKDAIDELRTLSTYDLTFEAARHGNVDLLLDMINHDNFKQQYIGFGLTDEANFDSVKAKLVQDIKDADYTYKNIYSNIFTDTISKPWLREVIIKSGVTTKAKLTSLTRQRDKARQTASNLKANSPAYSALKEQNKDKDFDNTLDNLVSNVAIKHLENEIKDLGDDTIKTVIKTNVKGLKQELREKHNIIKDKQAQGDFTAIKDIIENESIAKILDVFISAQNSLYEEVVNTNKSIPIIENELKTIQTNLNNQNLETFRAKINADSEVTANDTKETIETKIASINTQIENLNKTKKNPLIDANNPASNLDSKYLSSYVSILENRLKYLKQQQNKANSREVATKAIKDKNEAIVNSLQSLFNSLKIDTVKAKFSNKPPDADLVNMIQNYINKGSTNTWSTINKLINDTEFLKKLIQEGTLKEIENKVKEDLVEYINKAFNLGKSEQLIDALLRGLGYSDLSYQEPVQEGKTSIANEIINLKDQFKSTLTNDGSIKASVDFNAINPLNKDQVDLANKLMTRIVNSGDEPLFDETRPTVTFWFKSIAAQYARITNIEQLKQDIDVLKAAYRIIREAKINPETGTKYRYNTIKYIQNITAEDIINEFDLQNEHYEYTADNDDYIAKTGGKDSVNTFIYESNFDFIVNENGDLVISDKDRDRFDTLMNGVKQDTPVTIQVNSEYLTRKDQKEFKDNPDYIPLVVTVNNKGKNIKIASINTMSTNHDGVEYSFDKKDWTNVILDDINKTNTKAQHITDLLPQLQNWRNLRRIGASSEEISEALTQLLDADSFGIIHELLGKINPRTKEGSIALNHIAKVIFYGQNTSKGSEIASNRFNVINNIRNWKSKLYRDHLGNKKIRKTIGTDVTKTINTKITHITSGSILTTKGKKWNKLTIVDKIKNIKLFKVTDKRTLVNTRNSNETIEKTRGQYSNSIFVGVPTPRSSNKVKYIPIPVTNNKLNGSLLPTVTDNEFLDAVVKLIEQLGAARVERINNKSDELAARINSLEKRLEEVVQVDYKDNGNLNAVISNNKDIRFYSGERYIIYDYYNDKFRYERETPEGLAKKNISREEFATELGKLNRQVNFKSLNTGKYTDLLGNIYNTYEDYLIETNSIVTDIAQVVDSKGNKISNFVPRTSNKEANDVPLAINIDTSMLSIGKTASNNFIQFQNQFELDKKYDFIFNFFNTLLSNDEKKIKFNGVVVENKTEDGRSVYAWYDSNTNSISVSKNWTELYNINKENASLLIVHEILHALKGTRSIEQQKALDDKLEEFRKSILVTPEYTNLKAKENKTEIDNKILAILDMKGNKIDELLTYGLTDKDFAKFLDSIKGEVDGVTKTFWTKLLDIIKELAASFGITGSKLDELGVLFDKFISGEEINYIELQRAEQVKDLNRDIFDELSDEYSGDGEISHASFSSNESPIEKYTRLTNYSKTLERIPPNDETIPHWLNFKNLDDKSFYDPYYGIYIDTSNIEEFIKKNADDIENISSGGTHYFFEWLVDIDERGELLSFGVKLTKKDNYILVEYDPDTSLRGTLTYKHTPSLTEDKHFVDIYMAVNALYKSVGDVKISIPELKYSGTANNFLNPNKASSFSSSLNQKIANSPFSNEEEQNVLNILSQYTIKVLEKNYKGQKLKDFSSDAIRLDVLKALTNDVIARKKNNTITSDQLSVLSKLARLLKDGDERFWKLFRIHLSNLYNYTINDLEEYREDIEYIEKSWDQTDVYVKHPMDTANDRTKNLVNTTVEIDPFSVKILPDGNIVYETNKNTPTGFANTLSWSRYADKLYDLMQGALTKEAMLDALLKYAGVKNTPFAKSLYSIYDKLRSNSEALNAWFTTFDKAVVDSYRTLNRTIHTQDEGDLTELSITLGNKKGPAYILANEWTNIIVSRAESEYYDENWNKKYNDLYIQIDNATDNFTRLNEGSAKLMSEWFKHVGITVEYDDLLGEFTKGSDYFKKNVIDPIEYIKSSPAKKEKTGYIDRIQKNKNTRFNEFGNLYRLGTRLAYYRDDISNHSELNVKNNIVYDLRNPNFIINFFKKLKADDNTVIEFLTPYTKVPSNQHSFLLWGDEIVDNVVTRIGNGIFNFNIVNGIKQIDHNTPLNKKNIDRLKFYGYSGNKNLSEGSVNEYHELNKYDWAYETFLYYIAKGEYDEDGFKRSAIFPLLNPSDRKNTLLFEAPIVNISIEDWTKLIGNNDVDTAKETHIFKRLYNIMYDEIIAIDTAKKLLFELDNNGAVIYENNIPKVKQDILNNKISSQISYHYKLDDEGNKHYLEFKEVNGKLVIDTEKSGNIFGLNTMVVMDQNKQITFNDNPTTDISFIEHLLNTRNIDIALASKVNNTETYKDKLVKFIYRFVIQQYNTTLSSLEKYEPIISKTYLKKENSNSEELSYITKDKNFKLWVTEFALNTYLFNVEQTRLFYGNLADYKSNSDLNKRGGEVLANGISTTLRGVFYGATISDVKLKSKIYRNIADTIYKIRTGEKLENKLFNKFNKVYSDEQLSENTMKFSGIEREVYNIISPYLSNDSANGVSLITFDEFVKRISGFGLSEQYSSIINKIKNGTELNRSEITRFASMQKNFYYDLVFNPEMGKMVPNQIKNAEVILTPNLIKDLELETLSELMNDSNLGMSQINLTSAEKVGSFHIATITDKDGRLLDVDTVKRELLQAKREYKYENLRMQQEVNDALYEEEITLGRQIVKKMIENIPNDVEYNVAGEKLTGEELKDLYFYLAVENINQDRDDVLLEFGTNLDKDGNLTSIPSVDKVIEVVESMIIDLGLTKNMMFSIEKGEDGNPRVPFFFSPYSIKIQHILTSIFTNNINNQTFPGLHAPQMSSLLMNRKKGVSQRELQSNKGIQWHNDKKLDTKLKSIIVEENEEFEVIAAEVLLGRWAKEFYTEDGTVSINDLPEDVRTMIGYRIPTEGKFSIYRFKVVGFLPDDGPAIVLPDEFATQTGSDFDWDTVFALRYNLHKVTKEDKESVETIKYISGNTVDDFNERVEAVMADRKQLVHILSKKYKAQELLDILNRLNTLRSETEELSELNRTRYKEQLERIKVLDGIIKSSKGKNRQALDEKYELQALVYGDSRSIPYKQKNEYLAVKKDVSQILSKLSINEQNTKKARQNKIIDLYSAILTNKVHYPEMISISNFKDITRVGKEVDKLINNPIVNINNFTFEGQQKYRDLASQGRDLKGISVALDRLNSIANVIGIELNNNLDDDFGLGRINTLPKIRYRINNDSISRLKEAYKDDIEVEAIKDTNESYVTIVHRYVANNPAGTFTGVHGQLITSYSAQTTANIVDNVSHKLPNNVGKYMVDVWKFLPSIGSTFDISTKFINQPILRELVDYHEQIAGTVTAGREIEDIKRKYQTLLYRLQLLNGREPNERYEKAIKNGKSIVIAGNEWLRNKQYDALKYKNNTRIVLDETELNSNIDYSSSDKIVDGLDKNNIDSTIAKGLEDFVRYQLQILETYKIYRTYAKSISDVGLILNTDKLGAGPTFDTTTELLYNIEKAYNSKVLSIKNGNIMPKVFPKLFGQNTESLYPTLEAFLEASNLLSFRMFSSYFSGYSPLYMNIKRRLHEYTNKTSFSKKLATEIVNYLDNSLLKDLPWFNTLTEEDKQTLLGIGIDPMLKINLEEEEALQIFESLSVANQIRVYTDNYGNNNAFLKALSIKLQPKEIKKNEFHEIDYNNSGDLDEHTKAFNDLWYSDNIFERIIARNLIRYQYLVNGFKFGFTSFSKVIPGNILNYGTEPFTPGVDTESGIGLSTHLYGKLTKLNELVINNDTPSSKIDELSLQFFNSNYKERYLRSHWENNSLVPDAGKWRENGLRVLQPFGNPDGIISIPAKTLQNAATSAYMDRIKAREIIKLKYVDKWQLYQRVDNFATFEEGDVRGTYYYYPIGKLEYNENEEKSIFPSNNLLPNGEEIQSADDYKGLIETLNEKNKVNELIFHLPIAMNMTRKDGQFRDGLEQYNTLIELIRVGERTATTRHADTHEAEKWATLKVGDYVNLLGTDEYIKVTKTLTKIDLSSLPARQKWSEKEGWDITVAHKIQNDKDLYQFEFIYIGNKQAVIDDSNREYEAEDIEEISKEENIIVGSDRFYWSRFSKRGYEVSSAGDKRFSAFNAKLKDGRTIEEAYQLDVKGYRVQGNNPMLGKGKPPLNNKSREQLWNEYLNLWRTWSKENPKLLEELRGLVKNNVLTDKFATSNINQARALAQILNETDIDPQGTFKFSSYTSSVSPEINNAITTGIDFTKTTYSNLKVRAERYKKSKSTRETVDALNKLDIAEELTNLDLADLSTALIHILNYMRVELLTPRSEKRAGIVARLSEFENENMYDLVNDPIKRKDFLGTMTYALSFLQGVVTFDKLESTGNTNLTKDEQLVNEQIKELQNLLPLIKNTRSKFDRLLKNFTEIDLQKYTTNPEIKEGIKNIMDPGDDETYIQLQLDALADTNNPFIANMVKKFSINMIKADDASTVDIGEFESLLRKTFNKNITSLTADDFSRYLERKNGKPTGKLIQKYDWDKFYTDKKEYFEDIKKKYGKGSDDYYIASKKWFKENEITVVTEEEIDEIVVQKEKDLTAPEFYKWKKSNLRVENNKRAVKIGTSHLATPIDKYINPEWTRIKDDPLYQKFIEIIDKYSDYFGKETILTRGFIPTMTPEEKAKFSPKDVVEKWISANKLHRESESYVGENNEIIYVLTIPMVNYFTQEKEIKISNRREGEGEDEHIIRVLEETRLAGRGDFKSIYEILAENRKIRKENDNYHAGKIDYNLNNVFSKFIREANRYKAKAQMKHEFDLALYQVRHADFYSRDSKGKLIKNKVATEALKESTYKLESGENTNLANHYAQWLEAIFYGNFDIDEGNWTTISKMLLKFTSAKSMWLNFTAGINNVAFGKLQVRLEAVAKWYFSNKDLNKADSMYLSAIPDIIMNLGSTKAGNLANAIIKRLDVTQNTNERDYTTGMLKQQILSSSTFYIFNDMGEHYMQNVSALAMAHHARIIDGKIMSLADYKFENYKKALNEILDDTEKADFERYLKERFKEEEFKESKKDYLRDYLLALPINKSNAFIGAKKKLDASSEEEFNKHPRFIDTFYLDENGYAQLQNEIEVDGKKINTTLNNEEFEKFKLKALKVVQKEQGIYNREDAGMAQRRGLGKLMIQFRKYMRPGWNKRFGTKFGKSFWTESRDEWDKGMYVSMFNFLKTGIKRNYDLNESKEFHGMMGKILKDMYHFATNLSVYWNTLDDFEKGNIRRVMLEQLYLVATILVATMLKGLKPEDDDDENFAYDLAVYEIDRLYSNAMMYNPIGFINEGRKILKSPAAAQGTILDTYKLISNLVGYPLQTPEERVYKTGVYAGENKVMVNATKLVPILNKYQQLKRINKLNKYYILFRG